MSVQGKHMCRKTYFEFISFLNSIEISDDNIALIAAKLQDLFHFNPTSTYEHLKDKKREWARSYRARKKEQAQAVYTNG
jgi:hypothetical protein